MDYSYIDGDNEECNSSESGWTMYIASPMHEDDAGDDDGGGNYHDDEGDGNDSMTSDASSGPNHRPKLGIADNGADNFEHDCANGDDKDDKDDGDEDGSEYSGYLHKRTCKEKEKKGERRRMKEVEKDSPLHRGRNTNIVCSSEVKKMNS